MATARANREATPFSEAALKDTPQSPTAQHGAVSGTLIQVTFGGAQDGLLDDDDDMDEGFEEEDDPGYETSESVMTESIASSVRNYLYENGRRYHRYSEGSYPLPNDEVEISRLDLVHHLQLLILRGQLCLTDLTDIIPTTPCETPPQEAYQTPYRVLDCGTGTGTWALDFAEIYPSAHVTGVDLSPIQPDYVYPNVRFEIDDLNREWAYPQNYFSFIHSRHMGQSIRDWKAYAASMYTHIQPGGRVELVEPTMYLFPEDDSYNSGDALMRYQDLFNKAVERMGMPAVKSADELREALESVGWCDVEVYTVKIPWGSWAKGKRMREVGTTMEMVLRQDGFEAYAMQVMTRFLGMNQDEVRKLCRDAMADVSSRKVRSYQKQWYVLARKPLEAEAQLLKEGNVKVEMKTF